MDKNNAIINIRKTPIKIYRKIQYKTLVTRVMIEETIRFIKEYGVVRKIDITDEDIARNRMFINVKMSRLDELTSKESRNWYEYLEKMEEVTRIYYKVRYAQKLELMYYKKSK